MDLASQRGPRDAALQRRLDQHAPRLEAALRRLYGARPDFEAWLGDLMGRISAAADARSDALAALDLEREGAPDWFLAPDMLGYSAYVDRFAGTLKGLHRRIAYLQGLGVSYLHLLPFWRTGAGDNDGGFAVADYRQVREELGDIADLEPLTAALREAGISLCVDLVLNHTSHDHPWAQAAMAGDARYRDYYRVIEDPDLVARYEAALPQIFPKTAPGNFTPVEPMGGHVWTTFYPFQWDLNWTNPQVFAEFADIILSLANRGVEGFRLDSAAFLWKRLGTDCRGLPETHLILQALRAVVAIAAPASLLKSEVIGPVGETAQFLGSPEAPECHLTYHAGLMTAGWAALAEGNAGMVRAVIEATPPLPPGTGWLTYVRCHDDIGWMSLAPQAAASPEAAEARLAEIARFYTDGDSYPRGQNFQAGPAERVHGLNGTTASLAGLEAAKTGADLATAEARIALLYGLAMAAGGLPVIYMGDEYGQLNGHDFEADPARAHEGRWLHRPIFDEAAAAASLDPTTPPARIRARLQALAAVARNLPPLSPETAPRACETGSPAALGFRRGERRIALFNFSAHPSTAGLPAGSWRDLATGALAEGQTMLEPYGLSWLERIEA